MQVQLISEFEIQTHNTNNGDMNPNRYTNGYLQEPSKMVYNQANTNDWYNSLQSDRHSWGTRAPFTDHTS